ncbi:MAG: SDR family oxidoreductase [Deltaproteobacteria bacterium]|nr:SDR family oxidoreductase [Deltaproteobacteria bacterium]MCB9789178.1 SDR family oxidoreductase [Deltaproteobacteria bacterium]
MDGRAVLITGTHRGLGRALARAFAEAGRPLVVHGRREADALEVAAEVRSLGCPAVEAAFGDLREAALGQRLADAGERVGGVGTLILCAGILGPMQPLLDTPTETFAEVMRINVDAQHAVVRAVVPGMLARGRGVVLWLTSGLGRFALPNYGAYCASKHAVEGLAKVLHADYGERGIVSVAIAPGMVDTDMLHAAIGSDASEHTPPERAARGFVRFEGSVSAEHAGASLDIAPWLP